VKEKFLIKIWSEELIAGIKNFENDKYLEASKIS